MRFCAALAVRRAEEAELAELLARHFGVFDDAAVAAACAVVRWQLLRQGDTLFREGDESDSLYFVVRGRLLATRFDPIENTDTRRGVIGRGEVVGEIGLIRQSARNATVSALRDTVVAALDEPVFFNLVDRQPKLMLELGLKAVTRSEGRPGHSSPSAVVAVAVSPSLHGEGVMASITSELGRLGTVAELSRQRVDSLLESTGIADSEQGEVGEVRVAKLLHEAEMEADHLLLDLGVVAGAWSRRCLGMADRLLIVLPESPSGEDLHQVEDSLGGCPEGLRRTLMIVHPPMARRPGGSMTVAGRLLAEDVIHVRAGPTEDISRAVRVVVGRADTLVLGGGGGRGFAHIGVQRALLELGVPVDMVGGTSIGGIIGAAIADDMPPEDVIEWAQHHFARIMDYTIPVVSLIKAARIARSARETFGDRDIEDLWRAFFAISTDLTASRTHVHRSGSLALAMRATSAIPGVMPPVPLGDHLLIDGGVLNNLPIDVARELAPAGRVIAVDVTPPRGPGARTDYGLSVSGWDALRLKGKRAYPGISAVLMRSMITASMRERDSQVNSGLADC